MTTEEELVYYKKLYITEASRMVLCSVLENLTDYLLRNNDEYQKTTNPVKRQEMILAATKGAQKWLTDTLIVTAKDQ